MRTHECFIQVSCACVKHFEMFGRVAASGKPLKLNIMGRTRPLTAHTYAYSRTFLHERTDLDASAACARRLDNGDEELPLDIVHIKEEDTI